MKEAHRVLASGLAVLATLTLVGAALWAFRAWHDIVDTGAPTPVASATPSPEPTASPVGDSPFRLAGTVVGDLRYAVVEAPDGRSDLYRPGDTIPGLGRLLSVEETSARFATESGEIDLPLRPGLTPTAASVRAPASPTPRQ